jgi:restriction system protein
MPIPTQTDMFQFTLQQMVPGTEYTRRQIKNLVRDALGLSLEEQQMKTESGVLLYESRVGWAISWLNGAGYVERIRRGVYRITPAGINALSKNLPTEAFAKLVRGAGARQQPEHSSNGEVQDSDALTTQASPEELLSAAEKSFREELSQELMAAIMDIPGRDGDTFFEQIVTDLLVHMGYGEGRVTPASNDRGVDGIIKTDPLGFDPIFIQAKRYSPDNVVGRPDIQRFAGALGSITRGAFITTSHFQDSAREFARTYPHADIILIDGDKLTDLMIDYDLGVTLEREIKIKRIDTDYFSQDE